MLTDRETSLMQVLWETGPCTVREVRRGLQNSLAYTTVQTTLKRMERKGYVSSEKEAVAHIFAACISLRSAQICALNSLAERLFRGSIVELTEVSVSFAGTGRDFANTGS